MKTLLIGLAAVAMATATRAAPPSPPMTATALAFHVNRFALRVADLPRAVRFWQDAFGAAQERRSQVPNIAPDVEIAFLHLNGEFHIELVGGGELAPQPITPDIASDYRRAGYRHIAFNVSDLDATLARL
ncbi:hypothetical protein IP84_02370 [beta proteobacterium AAP99]|nr:hypothetical protein IP84_02370 [beta proteobacterium AAP99]